MNRDFDKWVEEYVTTPDSFRNAVKEQVEEELKKAQMQEGEKRMNKNRKKRSPFKVAVALLVFVCLISTGAYAVTNFRPSKLTGRPIDESAAENYENYDVGNFNQTVTPGWPQAMIKLFGEDREPEGVAEPVINITSVYYDGLSLTFYAKPTEFGKTCSLGAERLVIGDYIFMAQFWQVDKHSVDVYDGVEIGDCIGVVDLGGVVLPDQFRAELVLGVGKGTQNVAFDVQYDGNIVVKPATTVAIDDGVNATVDVMKIAASGTYIHITWEYGESQKALYDEIKNESVDDRFVYMSLDDSNGNHFTTEKNDDFNQSIVFYAEGGVDWSGSDQNRFYEENGKYYHAMGCVIKGMTEDVTSLTVLPYERTGMEEVAEHEYTYYDFAEFTVNFE